MTADERREGAVLDWRTDPGALLEGPLIGLERRRTLIALAYLLGFTALFAVSYAGTVVTIDGAHLETLTTRYDSLVAFVIVFATVTMAIAPLLYAVWNGGPLLSFAIPLVPVVLGDAAGGQYVLGLDAAIALTVGATASALALLSIDVRRYGSLRPWTYRGVDRRSLAVVTVLIVVAAVGIGRFVAAAPSHVLEWYAPFGALWLVTAAIGCSYWYARLRYPGESATRDGVNA